MQLGVALVPACRVQLVHPSGHAGRKVDGDQTIPRLTDAVPGCVLEEALSTYRALLTSRGRVLIASRAIAAAIIVTGSMGTIASL